MRIAESLSVISKLYYLRWRTVLLIINQGCGLGLDVSVSRRSRDVPTSRLGLVSRKKCQRLGLGQLCLVPKINFRPNCAGHINKTYAVWTSFRRRGFWSPHFLLPNICSLNLAVIIFVNFAVFLLILTSKLPVPSPLSSFILNLTTATHCTIIFHSLR